MNTFSPIQLVNRIGLRRGSLFGSILLGALLAFEIFNYSTTDFALTDLLGTNLKFIGLRWATILSIAFCGIDFAGIARLFTPEQGEAEPAEVWYLFGAWVLAAAMNAMLTWWGVSVAIVNHQALGRAIVSQETMFKVIPVFVAVLVWLIRILIIGTFAMAGDRLFSMAAERAPVRMPQQRTNRQNTVAPRPLMSIPNPRSEPSYHSVGMSAKARNSTPATRR